MCAILRIIPITIRTVAIIEKMHVRGINNFFITVCIGLTNKGKVIYIERIRENNKNPELGGSGLTNFSLYALFKSRCKSFQ
jgi:hypothetical protein